MPNGIPGANTSVCFRKHFLVYSNELNDVDQTTDKYTSIDLVYMSFHVPTNS